ncbi:MAG: DUF4214 domain-containing protein [Acidimicrobiales bacterium]
MRTPRTRSRRALGAVLAALAVAAMAPAAAASAAPARPAAPAAPRTTSCPAPAGNARYVRFIYLEILHRCPDAGARAFWIPRLDAGLERWRFAEAVDASNENLGKNNVDQLYPLLVGRAPTAAERQAGIDTLRARRENATLTAALISSAEAYAAHTSAGTVAERDREWLAFAYNRMLDRAPDANGQAFYLGYFSPAGSTREQRRTVAMGLERSRPNLLSWVRAAMSEALGRTPDSKGVDYWMSWTVTKGQWQTFRLWTTLLASNEAYQRSQLQPG